ncbi:MAG: aminopeptidase [Lachnospiraceae bacterium]|nr:aminopeptidase [Lachnospiraceae bacterium]
MSYLEEDIWERIELAIGRLNEVESDELKLDDCPYVEGLKDYFGKVSEFILYVYDVYNIINTSNELSLEYLNRINGELYKDILPANYDKSYANPDYAVLKLGEEYGKILSFLYVEMRSIIAYVYEGKMLNYISTVELFLEIYSMFTGEDVPSSKYIKESIYYHMYDYADVLVAERTLETICPDNTFATDIIINNDLSDVRYLYAYGEYIGENEIKTSKYLNDLPEKKVMAMAKTYVDGFIKGFETMRIDLKPKKTVNIRYSIGQEKMVKYAIELFKEQGLEPVIFRYPVSRINRKLTSRVGYTATPVNKQMEYDHRMDETLFFDKAFVERKLEVIADTYEKNKELALVYAGPAVIEVFGEIPFKPEICESALKLSDKQQKLSVEYSSKVAEITNKYIPRDKYSFTIIAYPVPEIGDNFEEIYDEIVKVNTLDNELYRGIQQSIIDELDKAEYVQILGKGDNKTDIKVMLKSLSNPEKETKFENCLADVNIPVGEVFTSPVLTGTEGVLNVSQVYLNELKYNNLCITFKDGRIDDYSCDNFDDEEENKAFIKENLMYNHDTLPIGEFAIGTNTTAYVMAHKYDIVYKLPILIVEKMGPHFAVGDTCYSYSEDSKLYNPDGKEIIAKDNECSLLRKSEDAEERSKAYFNCHTDITIPYEEIGRIYSVHSDGEKVAIIKDGRFVLEGTEELNKAFEE